MKYSCIFALAPLLLAVAAPVSAQNSQTVPAPQPVADASSADLADTAAKPVEAPKDWEFSSIVYVWGASVKGDSDIGSPPAVDIDLPFSTVLDHLKFAFMGAADARRDRLILLGDVMFTHIGGSKGIGVRDPDFVEADLELKTWAVTGLGGYRVAKDGPIVIDLLGGGRLNSTTTELDLSGPIREESGKVSETWVDPVIATRMHIPMSDKFSLSLYGDIAGILWGSDFSWQGVATVDYQLTPKMRLGAGWRYFKVDYDKGDFLYDIAQSGPFLGLRYVF